MSLESGYFDRIYRKRDDPWRLAERWYETRKRALTVAALPRERFVSALEVGCSIGTLTEQLAPRCDQLMAVDIAARAVELAQKRLAPFSHVDVVQQNVARQWPPGERDLVVFSEVGYYFETDSLRQLAARAVASLSENGVIVTCHWRHPVEEYPLTGEEARTLIREASGLSSIASYVDDDFGLDVLALPGYASVATREGLVPRKRVDGT
jgi:SAM-dependent methyltransferase